MESACKEELESNKFGTNEPSEMTMCRISGEEINPCLIPHVTDQIIQYLLPDTKHLRQARLVCKDWCVSSSQALRKVTRARIGEHCSNVQKLSDFLSLAEQLGMNTVSVTNFTFCQDVFQTENESVIKKFLLMYHPILESFTLWFDLKSTMSFDSNGFLLTTDPFRNESFIFPKLKHIEWDDRRLFNSETFMKHSGTQLLEWLLNKSPNLQSLSIHFESSSNSGRVGDGDFSSDYETDELLQRIFCPKGPRQNKLRHLRSLHLDVNINDKLLQILSEFFLHTKQMSSLTLCVRGSHFLPESFETMLSSVNEHLEELRLVSLCDKSRCTIRFPSSLRNLRLLEITGWNVNSGNIRFDSFSLSRNFPRIKTLVLDCWNDNPEWWQFLGGITNNNCNNNKGQIETVQELVLPEEIINKAKILDIVKVFPNLKKLDFPISSEEIEVLHIIFEHCSELTDLTVRRSSSGWKKSKEIMDSVFTGIPSDICMQILRSNSLNSRFPVLSSKIISLRTRPGITNLKKLKRLEIKDLQYLAEVTDVSGTLAFLEMNCLEYLNCGRSLMSTSCLTKLAEKFPDNMAYQSSLSRISPPFRGERFRDENYLRDLRKCSFL